MTDDPEPPPESKLTRSKERWAREGKFLTGKVSRPEEQRLPPGQHLTKDWPTLDLGLSPNISRDRWRLDVYGAVENPIFWDFAEFSARPQRQFSRNFPEGRARSSVVVDVLVPQLDLGAMNPDQPTQHQPCDQRRNGEYQQQHRPRSGQPSGGGPARDEQYGDQRRATGKP